MARAANASLAGNLGAKVTLQLYHDKFHRGFIVTQLLRDRALQLTDHRHNDLTQTHSDVGRRGPKRVYLDRRPNLGICRICDHSYH